MELYIYDRDLVSHGVIDEFKSFLWIRRYSRVGEFRLLVPFTPRHNELLQMNRLITKRDDPEAGEIKTIEKMKNSQGMEVLEVQGRMISSWLGKRLVLSQIFKTAPPQNIIKQIVTDNVTAPRNPARQIHNITHTDISAIERDNIDYQSEHMHNALIAVEEIAKAENLGFNITADIRQQKYSFNIYDGQNLTEGQTENPPIVFSTEFDNILEQYFTHCMERLRTTAYVESQDHHTVEVGAGASGLDRSEVFVRANNISQTFREDGREVTISLAMLQSLLRQRGVQTLEYFTETLNFTSRVNQHANLIYKKDFDLGDIVTCMNRRWGVRVNVRINEIVEIYQNHANAELEVTFGESVPALADALRHLT